MTDPKCLEDRQRDHFEAVGIEMRLIEQLRNPACTGSHRQDVEKRQQEAHRIVDLTIEAIIGV